MLPLRIARLVLPLFARVQCQPSRVGSRKYQISSALSPAGSTKFEERIDLSITDTGIFDYFSGNARFGADRKGKSIVVYGDLLCTNPAAISGLEGAQFGQLPDDFRPIYQRRELAQGYDTGTVLITASVDGSLKASRYSGSTVGSIWLPVDLTFHTA